MDWFSTSLLGPTRSSLQQMPWISTSHPGTMRYHSQGKTSTLTPSSTLNWLTLSAETMLRRIRTHLLPQTFRCRMHLQCMTSPLRDARLVEDAACGASVLSLQLANASVLPALCAEYDSPMVRHDFSNGETAKPTITMYMHTVLMEVSVTIMNCT